MPTKFFPCSRLLEVSSWSFSEPVRLRNGTYRTDTNPVICIRTAASVTVVSSKPEVSTRVTILPFEMNGLPI